MGALGLFPDRDHIARVPDVVEHVVAGEDDADVALVVTVAVFTDEELAAVGVVQQLVRDPCQHVGIEAQLRAVHALIDFRYADPFLLWRGRCRDIAGRADSGGCRGGVVLVEVAGGEQKGGDDQVTHVWPP